MPIKAKWTHDCQGKQDYDADILQLSTRYYPQGGGFHLFDGTHWADNDARPWIKPSAHAAIYLGEESLVSCEFEGETEQEVKAQVEFWVQQQLNLIELSVRKALAGNDVTP